MIDHKTLQERARELRRNPTDPEIRLWRHLSRSQLAGFKFRRQHVIYPRIVDLFCPSIGLIVEIDGHTHDADNDAVSDRRLRSRGFEVVRFHNGDVMSNAEGVVQTLFAVAIKRPHRWLRGGPPHPNPSPEGEGL